MRTTLPALLLALATSSSASSSLIQNLVAYFDFEETGNAGLVNKAPGASEFDATRFGGGSFNSSANPSGPGFSGNAAFNGGDGLSNRSSLLVGNALNLVDLRGDAIVVALGTAQLGDTFTVSAWHTLTPGANNTSARYFVFEASTNFDVSWGISSNDSYLSYVGQTAGHSATLNRNEWYLATHVFEASGGNTTLSTYLNGNPLGTRTAATSLVDFSALYFGRPRNAVTSPDRDWDGLLDEVAVWNRALSASEVSQLYNAGLAGIALTAIPEPSSAALLLLGAACTVYLRSNRRQ